MVSASETDPAGHPSAGDSPFPVVLWGYDRGLVDVRMAELVRQLDDEGRRAAQAEQALSRPQLDIEGGRSRDRRGMSLLRQTWPRRSSRPALSRPGCSEAGRQIEATVTAAEVKAADRLRAAAQQAGHLEQQARQLLAQAEMERASVEAAAVSAAERLWARADREARAVIARAQEDAELAWQDAVRQRQLLQAEAEVLVTLRQRMVAQLERLFVPLGLVVVDGAGEDEREAKTSILGA